MKIQQAGSVSSGDFSKSIKSQTDGSEFVSALDNARQEKVSSGDALSFLSSFESDWRSSQAKKQELIAALPRDFKPYLEGQVLISNLSLKAQLVSKIGEGVSASIRRVQSFGS